MAKKITRTNSNAKVYNEAEFGTPADKILGDKFRLKCKNEAQKEFVRIISEYEIVIAAGPAGTGKAQPLDANILTPEGWVTMGDISVGDTIIGDDGKHITVIETHPQGIKPIYEVTFSDGAKTRCTEDHLWLTRTELDRNSVKKVNGVKYKSPRNGTVKTLSDIKDSIIRRGRKNHSIPIVNTVEFNSKELIIDPYLMGVLLGDGSITTSNISITTADIEIVSNIESVLNEPCYIKQVNSSKYSYGINSHGRKNPVLDELRRLNLFGCGSHTKFIPDDYIFNNAEVRMAILQGLMDTDGTVSKKGFELSFTSVSDKLINGIGTIIRSLGGTYSVTKKMGKYRNKLGELIETSTAYTIFIKLPNTVKPFRLSRKQDLIKEKTKYGPIRYVTNVEYVGEYEAKCITVDNNSSLYVTDDFIVTHNSYLSIGRAIELLHNVSNPYNKIVICKPAVEAEEKIGFIPGTEREKLEPHIASSLDIIDKMIGQFSRKRLEEKGILVIQPLGYIRGKTLDNSIIIIEEAQNLSPNQCKTILTRIGSNSKLIISGDIDQSDKYKNLRDTGLYDIITRHKNIPEIGFFEFTKEDIVRNPIIGKILNNYPQLGESDILKDCITPRIRKDENMQVILSETEKNNDQKRLFDKIISFIPKYR